jgi:hypothetical protein
MIGQSLVTERFSDMTPNEMLLELSISSKQMWVRAQLCKLQKRVHSTHSRK